MSFHGYICCSYMCNYLPVTVVNVYLGDKYVHFASYYQLQKQKLHQRHHSPKVMTSLLSRLQKSRALTNTRWKRIRNIAPSLWERWWTVKTPSFWRMSLLLPPIRTWSLRSFPFRLEGQIMYIMSCILLNEH